jgi:TetR/AcrR family transcriptional regulator, regulator of cefoperazone and chloramphenicol sensitivity
MPESATPPADLRDDSPTGPGARERLLGAALQLFAERGFTKASTREIAAAAGVNIGLISYYFGDKQGLYKAAFTEPLGDPKDDISVFAGADLSLEQALFGLYTSFFMPLKMGAEVQWCLRLHFREMSEPTGVWEQEIKNGIVPYQLALQVVLRRHITPAQASDRQIQRLGCSIVALAVVAFMGRDVSDAIDPTLMNSPEAIDELAAHSTRCALAMVRDFQTP